MSLEQQLSFQDRQIELGQEGARRGGRGLVEQGLAVAPRRWRWNARCSSCRATAWAAKTALLRARQESEPDRDPRSWSCATATPPRRRRRCATPKTAAERDLHPHRHRGAAALPIQMRTPLLRAGAARVEPRYAIVRPDGDGTVELAATESTPSVPATPSRWSSRCRASPPRRPPPRRPLRPPWPPRLSPPRAKRCPCLRSTRRPDPPAAAAAPRAPGGVSRPPGPGTPVCTSCAAGLSN